MLYRRNGEINNKTTNIYNEHHEARRDDTSKKESISQYSHPQSKNIIYIHSALVNVIHPQRVKYYRPTTAPVHPSNTKSSSHAEHAQSSNVKKKHFVL